MDFSTNSAGIINYPGGEKMELDYYFTPYLKILF